jgi:hypothetical protein
MGVFYSRTQRAFIKDPATIGDIPFEVIKKSLGFLVDDDSDDSDLLAASLVCRGWLFSF